MSQEPWTRFATEEELQNPSVRGTTWDESAWHVELVVGDLGERHEYFVCPKCFALVVMHPPRISDDRDTRLVHADTHHLSGGFGF